MRKLVLFSIAIAALACVGTARAKSVIVPGNGHIDVETLNKKIPLDIDVSKLNLYEIRVLKAAFEARQGRWVNPSELRGLFKATSWYETLANSKDYIEYNWDAENDASQVIDKFKLKCTSKEQAFINKLEKAEKALLAKNLSTANGVTSPNLSNLANPMQVNTMPDNLGAALAKFGFAISPDSKDQLFQVYENNDYHSFPNFVTTDLYMQAFHLYFDNILRKMEEQKMMDVVANFSLELYNEMVALYKRGLKTDDYQLYSASQYAGEFFSIAHSLATDKSLMKVDQSSGLAGMEAEIARVKAYKQDLSPFLGYEEIMFNYSLYRPRGHYTRSEALKRYFHTMMWLQNAPFATDNETQFKAALLIANAIGSNPKLNDIYKSIEEPFTFMFGTPDNVSLMQVYELIKQSGKDCTALFADETALKALKAKIEELDDKQTRIRPKFEFTSHCKLNVFPQRYMPDSEVLLEMVDYENKPTLRDVPKGLDVMAAMGITAAERILLKELKEQERWNKYTETLEKMKGVMKGVDWQSTISNQWMATFQATCGTPSANAPYFMHNPQWDKKNLNACLASWAELKHDAILYAKQPSGAECGGGGEPEPVVVGYVEPNVAYWTKAIELLDATEALFGKYGMMTDETSALTASMREMAQFLLNVSQKELRGEPLTESEFNKIKIVGSDFEYLTMQILDVPSGSMWEAAVDGTDKKIAVVADVYTANSPNNPAKSVLYEAVGPAHTIYVVTEINGYLYLTRGAVFSYREFQEDLMGPRKTDEEWQEELEKQPNKGIPDWMKEIVVPVNGEKLDNEYMFYSSGC